MNGRLTIPIAVLAGALGAWALLHVAKPGTDAQRQAGAIAAGQEAAADANAATMPQAKQEDRPLPPLDMPLGAVIEDLKRRADRGEAGAACRLAAEWTHCAKLESQLEGSEAALRNQERIALRLAAGEGAARMRVSAEAIERGIDFAQSRVDRSKRELAHCDGVPAARPDEITRYWRQAALAGHLPSMRNYAVGNGFRRNEILDNLPALAVYRQEAERIARQAVDRGDLRAAIALAGAYSPLSRRNGTYLSQLVDPDAGASLALLYRIKGAIDKGPQSSPSNLRLELAGMIEDLETTMPPQQVQGALARAQAAPPLVAGDRDLQGLHVMAAGFVPDMPREECDLAAWNKGP